MLVNWIRVVTSDDTVYTDNTAVNEDASKTVVVGEVAAEDFIYVGKVCAYNNFYLSLDVLNTESSVMSIEYWDGLQWRAAVDMVDGTAVNGATLAQDGGVVFVPNKDYKWDKVDDTSETSNSPTELRGYTIYDLYWVRIKFSANLTTDTAISRLFYAFTTTQIINSIDNDAPNYLTAFGQTDWSPQIFTAAKEILADLKSKNILTNEGQLLSIEAIAEAAAYKTLALIYFNLGEDYNDKYEKALKTYNSLMVNYASNIDRNNNAVLDESERKTTNGRLTRV